jgi:hypothetical protein
MKFVCGVVTVWRSLRYWNPFTEMGWMMVDGHDYIDEDNGWICCERCGHREKL